MRRLTVWLAMTVMIATASSASAATPLSPGYFDEDHYLAIDGTRLHFRVRGYDRRNPYLLILHGGPGASALEFYPWGEQLEHRLNLVYLDQRGSGLSDRASFAVPGHPTPAEARGFDFATMTEDIEGVRRALGVDTWFVLGHSFGGMLGLEYVTAYSEHVSGYIHMDGLLSVPAINAAWLAYAERAIARTARLGDPADAARVALVRANIVRVRAMPDDERDRQIGPLVIANIMPEQIRDRFPAANAYDARIDAEVLRRYGITPDKLGAREPGQALTLNEGLAEREAFSLLDDVRIPTLIISGADDPIIPPPLMAKMHRLVPRSRLVTIDKAGHEAYKDQPKLTADAVLAFTASPSTARR